MIIEKGNDDVSDTEVSVTSNVKSKSFNVFDVVRRTKSFFIFWITTDDKLCPQLNQNSDKDEDTDDRQEDEDLVTNNADYNNTKHRKKKKKHKRLENERVKSQQERDAECNKNVDEIEQSIREVNKLLGELKPSCSNQVSEAQWVNRISKENVLTVQRKHLNPYNELKRIFGSKTIEAGQRYNYIYTYNYVYLHDMWITYAAIYKFLLSEYFISCSKRSKGRPGNLKKTWLICPQDNTWVPTSKSGLSMSLDHSVKTTGNIQYFVYEHSASYKEIQHKFLQAVESLNPENIIVSQHAAILDDIRFCASQFWHSIFNYFHNISLYNYHNISL